MLDLLDLLGLRLEPFFIQLSSCPVIVALGRAPTAPAANVADARLGQHIRPSMASRLGKLEECEISKRPERRSYDTTEHEYHAVRQDQSDVRYQGGLAAYVLPRSACGRFRFLISY